MSPFQKGLVIIALLTIAALYASGASDKIVRQGEARTLPAFTVPETLEPVLHQYRQGWTQATDLERSALHWSQGVVIYMNQGQAQYRNNHARQKHIMNGEEQADANTPGFTVYPHGTVLLKENYTLEQGVPPQPASVTIMLKRETGYDPTMGDWQFVQFDPAGKMIVNGSSRDPEVAATCAVCHRGMVERDYVFSTLSPTAGDRP
jgi:cytochrome P460